jgi:hypothetical protein
MPVIGIFHSWGMVVDRNWITGWENVIVLFCIFSDHVKLIWTKNLNPRFGFEHGPRKGGSY